jgi:TonB family protein
LVGASAVALAAILAGPRLLRHPEASAQAQQAVVVPGSTAVTAPPETPRTVKPAAAKVPEAPAPVVSPPETAPPAARSPVEASSDQVVHKVLPEVPEFARRTIRGSVKIQVRATVDASGHVTDAKVESQNSRYFAKLALEAARQWDFAAGPTGWLLRFEFTASGTAVHPSPLTR